MKSVDKQIEAYEAMQDELEAEHFREWVVFYDEELVDTYPSFADAFEDARIRFGSGPYLIGQVAAPPASVPAVWRVDTEDGVDLGVSSSYVHVEREAPSSVNSHG